MLSIDLISHDIPHLKNSDSVGQALQLMTDFKVEQLPLVANDTFLGLINDADLLEFDDMTLKIEQLDIIPDKTSVFYLDFFLTPLRVFSEKKLSVIPVVKEGFEFAGVITASELLIAAANYNSVGAAGGVVILEINPSQFSISEIGRIVESNNARVIHLNTWTDTVTGNLMVSVKVNRSDIQDILASFERYEYPVKQYFGENLSEEQLRVNYDNLMNYLSL